jgi:hypothetical protein
VGSSVVVFDSPLNHSLLSPSSSWRVMGVMRFLLPADLPAEVRRELGRSCVIGADHMPYPTEVRIESDQLILSREVNESGAILAPWNVPGSGLLMMPSASLMERPEPYHLGIELARGKVNQVRNQAADWQAGGLYLSPALAQNIQEATAAFGRAATHFPTPQAEQEAQSALVLACHAADKLVQAYVSQVFHLRHQRQPCLDTALGCRLGPRLPQAAQSAALVATFNTAVIFFPWPEIEPSEGDFRWQTSDALLTWALAQGLRVLGGPLVDFALTRLPGWVWQLQQKQGHFFSFVCDYVEVVVKRYQDRIRTWQLSSAANLAPGLAVSEDDILWLTLRMADTIRRIDPALEIIFSVAQPWGDYLTGRQRLHSPFVFADTLLRNGLRLAALDLELVMGITPWGSYCRDLLEVSRILDLYALLGVPLQVTLGYPAQTTADPQAEAGLAVDAGHWRMGISPQSQADWAAAVAELALAKPYVRAVHWVHFSDAEPHQFPHCGLADGQGAPRPALERLRQLRQQHLK